MYMEQGVCDLGILVGAACPEPPLIVERMFANVQFCERVIVGGGKAPMASTAGLEPAVAVSKAAALPLGYVEPFKFNTCQRTLPGSN